MRDEDRGFRQFDARVQRGDRGVVPLGDLAEEYPGDGFAVEPHLARLDARHVDDRHDATHHHRPLERSEEHTSELKSLMRISYAVFCLKKKNKAHISNNEHMTNYKHKKATTKIY